MLPSFVGFETDGATVNVWRIGHCGEILESGTPGVGRQWGKRVVQLQRCDLRSSPVSPSLCFNLITILLHCSDLMWVEKLKIKVQGKAKLPDSRAGC